MTSYDCDEITRIMNNIPTFYLQDESIGPLNAVHVFVYRENGKKRMKMSLSANMLHHE